MKAGEPVVSLFPNDLPDTFLCATCQQYGKGPFRHDFPGEVGNRNQVRGDGYAGFDMGLGKIWKMPYRESHTLSFRWEVFNVFNINRFDVASVTNGIDQGEAFGNYSGLLTSPRVMQFSLATSSKRTRINSELLPAWIYFRPAAMALVKEPRASSVFKAHT